MLQINHARLIGAGAARDSLAAALGAAKLPDLRSDETLYIPVHRSRAVLRPHARSFADTISAELDCALANAVIDPAPGASARAYRFTTRTTLAIWLLGTWLRGGGTNAADAAEAVVHLSGGSAIGWARRDLFGDGRALPAVFAGLAGQGLAAALLARIDPIDVARIERALAASHGLPPAMSPAAHGPLARTALPPAALPTAVITTVKPDSIAIAVAATAAALRAAGNDLAELGPAHAALLVAIVHLDSNPAVPRMALAIAAGAAIAAVAGGQPTGATERPPEPAAAAPPNVAAALQPYRDRAPSRVARRGPHHAHGSAADTLTTPMREPPLASQQPAPIMSVGFASDFAGLFFLLNAFLAMGLYPDFTRPADQGLALAPTRLLDRLALQWFGRRYRDDHLHRVLASADDDPLVPARWRVVPAWLAAFPEAAIGPTVATSRYRTRWHPAGFPMADVPLRTRDVRRRPQSGTRLHYARLPSAQQQRWLACLALYLDARIRRASDDPGLGLNSLAIPGRCRIGAQRIDIDLALADLPLPLRLAGLDRDPGWLPAEGRSIALHFQ
jgi:hypothetical protein